jgi:type VI secretion system secreted protein VgrG
MSRRLFCLFAFAAILYAPSTGLADLGSAKSFAVLGASTVTNTGPTTIYGSVGVDPGSAITGFPPGIVTGGSIYGPGDPSLQARLDATTAYNTLAALSGTSLTGQDLGGGRTITPGVYTMTDVTAYLNGALTLDAQGLPNARFVFNLANAFTTGSNAVVNVIGGDPSTEIYWVIGSSATLGTDTTFAGNILADQSITLTTGADILCGRAIALNAAVTMDTNKISNNNTAEDFLSGRSDFGSYGFSGGTPVVPVPLPAALVLGCLGMGSAFAFGKRKFFSES